MRTSGRTQILNALSSLRKAFFQKILSPQSPPFTGTRLSAVLTVHPASWPSPATRPAQLLQWLLALRTGHSAGVTGVRTVRRTSCSQGPAGSRGPGAAFAEADGADLLVPDRATRALQAPTLRVILSGDRVSTWTVETKIYSILTPEGA